MNVARLQQTLYFVLFLLSYIYKLVMGIRRTLCDLGLFQHLDIHCPCISVGNISWGGTGKTPIIDWLLDWSENNDIQSIVLTRGYKARSTAFPLHVKSYHTANEVGDEPFMLALEHPKSSIIVDPNRVRSGQYAMQTLQPELVLLDDGFQYVRIKRSLDLVLLTESDLTDQWDNVIPAGSWREGSQALHKASAFLIKADRIKMQALLPMIQKKLFRFRKPVFSFYLKPLCLRCGGSLEQATASVFLGREYLLVTGVGEPSQVLQTAVSYVGHPPEKHLTFPDHHYYTFRDIDYLLSFKLPIICTMKDLVKLQWFPLLELWGLQVKVVFEGSLWSQQTFSHWLSDWWDREQLMTVPPLGYHSSSNLEDNNSIVFFEEQEHQKFFNKACKNAEYNSEEQKLVNKSDNVIQPAEHSLINEEKPIQEEVFVESDTTRNLEVIHNVQKQDCIEQKNIHVDIETDEQLSTHDTFIDRSNERHEDDIKGNR